MPARPAHCVAAERPAPASRVWAGQDEGDLKFTRLHEHAWGGDDPTIWLDRACIDQTDVNASLAVLPIFLRPPLQRTLQRSSYIRIQMHVQLAPARHADLGFCFVCFVLSAFSD